MPDLSPTLTWTAVAALLISVMWVPYVIDRIMRRGAVRTMSNPKEDDQPPSEWGFRCQRAHIVAVESFTAFAPVAIIAGLHAPANPTSGTAAMVYFIALATHFTVYTIGVPFIRTLAFAVCCLATIAIALSLLGVA